MSGSPDFFSQADFFTTKYEIKVNKYKMYREAFFRCLAKQGCGALVPDEGTMINAAHTAVQSIPYYSGEVKQALSDRIQ